MTIAAGFKVFCVLISDSLVSAFNIFTGFDAKSREKVLKNKAN
jgi:hypothetical protein